MLFNLFLPIENQRNYILTSLFDIHISVLQEKVSCQAMLMVLLSDISSMTKDLVTRRYISAVIFYMKLHENEKKS